jgi:hypothetical protein
MSRAWPLLLAAIPAMAQAGSGWSIPQSGWGMSLGTGFSEAPVLVDVHYTFPPGFGLYLGGGGTPRPNQNDFSFNFNLNDKGTLRKVQTAGYLGLAVTRHPRVAWGVGYGQLTTSWEVDHSGWFTAEEMAQLDSSRNRQGAHGWVGFYPGRSIGVHVQAGPGWGGVSLGVRFR